MQFVSFPKIGCFRNAYAEVKYHYMHGAHGVLPKLRYFGSIKIHGRNSAIVKHIETNQFTYQSRNRIINKGDDDAGFYSFIDSKEYQLLFDMIEKINDKKAEKHIVIYGEYAGEDIQPKVAVSKLPKMFLIFAVRFDEEWLDLRKYSSLHNMDEKIYNIMQFSTYYIPIDFQEPSKALDEIAAFTDQVNDECPVAKLLGVSGIGEGLVWTCIDNSSSRFWFKTKGKDHENGGGNKVKSVKISVDPEKVNNSIAFAETYVNEPRLTQGLEYLKENNYEVAINHVGIFIKWVLDDILKEEHDVIKVSSLDEKMLKKAISNRSVVWFKLRAPELAEKNADNIHSNI